MVFDFLHKLAGQVFQKLSPGDAGGGQPQKVSPTARPPVPKAEPDAGKAEGGSSWLSKLNPFPSLTEMGARIKGLFSGGDEQEGKQDGPAAAARDAPKKDEPKKIDPTPEQVEMAEATRGSLSEEIDKLGDLKPEQKERILARVGGLGGSALVTEMNAVRGALAGENADRALAAYADIDKLAAKNPETKDRLSPEIVGMLVTGVGDSRTDSERGRAGVLGAKQARESAQTLLDMKPEDFTRVKGLLEKAGKDKSGKPKAGADPSAEQALILKAVAARDDAFEEGGVVDWVKAKLGAETRREKAARELEQFADDIRGMDREELIQSTSLLDLDDKNTSTYDPAHPEKKNTDDKVDNDGLFQRFDMSCGPTTAQMVRGEVDPAYALRLRKNDFNDPDPTSELAQEQQHTLEMKGGGTAVNRMGGHAKKEARERIEEMREKSELSATQQSAFEKLLSGNKLEGSTEKEANEALDALRAKNDGHPTDEEIAAVRANKGKVGAGMVLGPALQAIAGDAANVDYTYKMVDKGMTADHLKNIESILEDGQPVPMRIAGKGNEGHFMMVSDVRPAEGGGRMFLVSDPWSGATRWVPEADFQSGDFTTKQFELGQAKVTTFFVDDDQQV